MSAVFDKPSPFQRMAPMLRGFDGPLAFAVFILACGGLLTMYSSGFDHGTRFVDHARNMLIAGAIMFVVAQIPPQRLMSLAVPLYIVGITLLIAVAVFGITKKGARRWLNVGMVVQPSEMLKIAMPLMLAWWFQKREGQLRPLDFLVAGTLLVVPVGLIMKQPDLGTSILVVEQNAAIALATADDGYIMELGRVVAAGTCAELMAKDDVKEFYLGGAGHADRADGQKQRWKRRKTWR